MGTDIIVMIPRDRLKDLYPRDVARLLHFHGLSWHSLPEYLHYESYWVNEDRCFGALLQALSDYKECVESPDDFEVSCDFFLKDILKMIEICSVLRDYSAVFVADTSDKKLCELYKFGYVPIIFVLRLDYVEDVKEWYRRECK